MDEEFARSVKRRIRTALHEPTLKLRAGIDIDVLVAEKEATDTVLREVAGMRLRGFEGSK